MSVFYDGIGIRYFFSIFKSLYQYCIGVGILKYHGIGIGSSIFFRTITIFPSLLVPYQARVSKRSAAPVLLDCS